MKFLWRPDHPLMSWATALVAEWTLRVMIAGARAVPDVVIDWLAAVLCRLLPALARKEAAAMVANVEHVLGLPRRSSFARLFYRQCYRHQVLATFETIRGFGVPARVVFEGVEDASRVVREAASSGRGVILVAGHVGNWELAGIPLAPLVNHRLYGLAKPSKNAGVTRVLDRMRAEVGHGVIWTGSPTTMATIAERLAEGAGIGFIMDQKPTRGRGVEVEFLGFKTAFPAGAAVAALASRAPVVSFMAVREGRMRYRVLARRLLSAEFDGETVESITERCAREIERVVRLYPEQWVWNYRRWKWQ